MPRRSRSAIKRSRRMPSPIQTNLIFGFAFEHLGRDGDDVVVPLELEEPGHRRERDLVTRQPELPPNVFPRPSGIQEGLRVHAAVNGRELLRMADTGRPCLLGHGVADADDGVAPPGGPLLQGDVEPVPERTLERPERHAVDRVHHDRHLLVPGRRAAEDSRLRAVSMHDMGLESAESRAEL